MKNFKYPKKETWGSLCERPSLDVSELENVISTVFTEVQNKGDQALLKFAKSFDDVEMNSVKFDLSDKEFFIDPELQDALIKAVSNIKKFHQAQNGKIEKIETVEGVTCWRKNVAIQNVGLYIPGGSAPLFSTLLMLAIPAQIAGCSNIVVCTPPTKEGSINEVIGWTCQHLGIKTVYLTGGAQAIAAMTFGTASIPKVDKLFGPGNQYVTAAKQLAQKYGAAIDMPAGPSEVLVIADDTAVPSFVAADLLSQAEHGTDSQVVLVSDSDRLINDVRSEIENQIKKLPRKAIATEALAFSKSILFENLDSCVDFSNSYAPEHLIIATRDAEKIAEKITIAGSVFIGNWSCESAGDYASGTNHTLPTNGYARNHSGVSLDSFVNKITFQMLSEKGIQTLGPTIEKMAEAERLQAHKNAVSLRLDYLNSLSQSHTTRENKIQKSPPSEGGGGRRNSYNNYNKDLKTKAKELRNHSTIAEATLWKYVLRASGLGYPFRRQRPIGNYIVDFVSLPLKLVIEVDGLTHSYEKVHFKDTEKDLSLKQLGFTIIRIPDDAILANVDRVRNYLIEEIKNLPPLSPCEGGELN